MRNIGSFLFFLTSSLVYSYSLGFFFYDVLKTNKSRFENLMYFTIWNFILQTLYSIISTVNALNKLLQKKQIKKQSDLDRFCDRLYSSLIFPIATVLVSVFWALFTVDRELIYPARLDSFIPVWMNHVMHTLPLVTCLTDLLLNHHNYNSYTTNGLVFTVAYNLGYGILLMYLGLAKKIWIYPFIELMKPLHLGVFMIVYLVFVILFYKIGEKMNNSIWNTKSTNQKLKQKKNK